MSHALASTSSAIFVLNVVLLSGVGFVLLASGSVWIGIASLAVASGINVFAWSRMELRPIDSASVKSARRVGILVVLIAVVSKLFMQ